MDNEIVNFLTFFLLPKNPKANQFLNFKWMEIGSNCISLSYRLGVRIMQLIAKH